MRWQVLFLCVSTTLSFTGCADEKRSQNGGESNNVAHRADGTWQDWEAEGLPEWVGYADEQVRAALSADQLAALDNVDWTEDPDTLIEDPNVLAMVTAEYDLLVELGFIDASTDASAKGTESDVVKEWFKQHISQYLTAAWVVGSGIAEGAGLISGTAAVVGSIAMLAVFALPTHASDGEIPHTVALPGIWQVYEGDGTYQGDLRVIVDGWQGYNQKFHFADPASGEPYDSPGLVNVEAATWALETYPCNGEIGNGNDTCTNGGPIIRLMEWEWLFYYSSGQTDDPAASTVWSQR